MGSDDGAFLSVVRYSKNERTQRFGNCICFRPQVRGRRHLLCRVSEKELPQSLDNLWQCNYGCIDTRDRLFRTEITGKHANMSYRNFYYIFAWCDWGKTTKTLSHDTRCPARDSNRAWERVRSVAGILTWSEREGDLVGFCWIRNEIK
jgi:hypothetical protein